MVLHDDASATVLAEKIAKIKPKTVFHLAGKFIARHNTEDVDDLVASNLGFATRVAEAAVRAGCQRMIVAGTSWQVDQFGREAPNSLYAATKAAFEAILAHYAATDGLRVMSLRLYDTFGADDPRGKLLSLLLSTLASGSHLGLSPGDQRIDLVHVEDVVEAFLVAETRLIATEHGGFERFTVRSGQPISIKELVAMLEQLSGRKMAVAFGERPYRKGEAMEPAPGEILPDWRVKIGLKEGLAALVRGG